MNNGNKVTFSPTIVARLIAYYEEELQHTITDEGIFCNFPNFQLRLQNLLDKIYFKKIITNNT